MFKIEDGKGKGNLAGVSDEHRLLVNAVQESKMENLAEDNESAYLTYMKRDIASADTYEAVGYLMYTGSHGFHIEKIILTGNEICKFEVFVEPTSVSGGDARVPLNTNRRSGKTLDCTCLTGSTAITGTVDSNKELLCANLQADSTFAWELKGALILPKNSSIWIQAQSPTIGAKLRAVIFGYEDTH